MKHKAYAITSVSGRIVWPTVRRSKRAAIRWMVENTKMPWKKLRREGCRAIPLTITHAKSARR